MNFEKLKPSTAAVAICCICLLFCVEFTIFLLNRTLFLSSGYATLLTMGIGIATPVILINRVVYQLIEEKKENITPEEKIKHDTAAWGIGAVLSIVVISLVNLVSYFLGLSLKTAVWSIVAMELFALIIAIYFSRNEIS